MRPKTYLGFLNTIVGDEKAFESEKSRLDVIVRDISSRLRSRLTTKTVPSLLWHLALKEIHRVSQTSFSVSDFGGHARFLRALSAAIPFCSVATGDDPKTDELLELCHDLWWAIFYREMIDDLKQSHSDDLSRQQRMIAAQMSILNTFQGEVAYVEQAEDRIERLFSSFSHNIVEPSIGVSVDEIVTAFRLVRNAIPNRVEASARLMQPVHEMHEEFRRRASAGATKSELDEFVFQHPKYEEIGKRLEERDRLWNEILLFEPRNFQAELGDRGQLFLEAFSFVPGKVNLDTQTPFDDDEVRRRPFARIGDDRFVLLDYYYCSFSPLYRLPECFDDEKKRQRLSKQRDKTLEDEAAELFGTVIEQPDATLRSYYLPIGSNGDQAERDLLILKGDCLFLIESKARPLRAVKGRRDKLIRILDDVKASIQEGYKQACDVIHHLKSSIASIPIFDSNYRQTAEIDVSNVQYFIPIVFLDSYYGLIATDLQPWLALDNDVGFPWVVDRDTFASIVMKIDSFEKLRSFLLWRKKLHGIATNEDEAVFAGAFIQHGPFEMPANADCVQFPADYADVFDAEYFRRKGFSVPMPMKAIHPPVLSSMQRVGDEIVFEIDGKFHDSINIQTGMSRKPESRTRKKLNGGKVGRNDPCPCGSGLKFKKCCLRF